MPRRTVARVLLGDHEVEVAREGLQQRRLRLALGHRHAQPRMRRSQRVQHLRHQRERRRLEHRDPHRAGRLVQRGPRGRTRPGRAAPGCARCARRGSPPAGSAARVDRPCGAAGRRPPSPAGRAAATPTTGSGAAPPPPRRWCRGRSSSRSSRSRRTSSISTPDSVSKTEDYPSENIALSYATAADTGGMTIAPDAPTIDPPDDRHPRARHRGDGRRRRRPGRSAGWPSRPVQVDPAAERLAGVLKDPRGLAVHGRLRRRRDPARGPRIAARNFAALAKDVPRFLPLHLQLATRLGAVAAVIVPPLVIPIVRRVLRGMVGHLIVDARDAQLGKAIKQIRSKGARLNVNLLGEAVLGEQEAARRLEGTHGCSPRRHRLRLDQGLVDRRAALDLGVRRGRRARRRAPDAAVPAGRRVRARRSSSTSTWRSTATSTSRSRSSPPSSTSPSSSTSRPASCCRPTCRTRSAR